MPEGWKGFADCVVCGKSFHAARAGSDYCTLCRLCGVCGNAHAPEKAKEPGWGTHWCTTCGQSWEKHGLSAAEIHFKKTATDEEIFWSLVEVDLDSGCWLWKGHRVKSTGHGRWNRRGWKLGAYVYSLMLYTGEEPNGRYALHSLECPNPHCVFPAHLRWGTHEENMEDLRLSRRKRKGYTVEDEYEMSRRHKAGETHRQIAEDYNLRPGHVAQIILRHDRERSNLST